MQTRLADTISCFKIKKKNHKDSILIIALLLRTAWNVGFFDSLSLKQGECGICVDIRNRISFSS